MSPVSTITEPARPKHPRRSRTTEDMPVPTHLSFKCAVTDSKGPRRTMEDAHSVVVPFAGVRGQGFFAIFDGHAGKQAADWCGKYFASSLADVLREDTKNNIPDVLNKTFHDVDTKLSKLSEQSSGKMHAGCTVVTAFLRLEDSDGGQSFLPLDFDPLPPPPSPKPAKVGGQGGGGDEDEQSHEPGEDEDEDDVLPDGTENPKAKRHHFRDPLEKLEHVGERSTAEKPADGKEEGNGPDARRSPTPESEPVHAWTPAADISVRRVLYCANAGDARGVLCRGGKAVRLTYDHKGSDKQEAKRITDAGGFVMSGRVNGVLAVTRSLGDSSMKEYVVGSPYTTETELSEEDEFLILACDGLWDVVDDQAAVDLVRGTTDPRRAAEDLLDNAYKNYSTDNVTVLVVRFRNPPEGVRLIQ
ncbi:hypothetical protein AcV5_006988 [Taiwanofungus camphoratus]|nr:hypothetical protein AcV5_006988 [Antrodia cinnamomea]KAI0958871.1 hypothetical protein AcV7_004567 [Antrodia cinnamomea]